MPPGVIGQTHCIVIFALSGILASPPFSSTAAGRGSRSVIANPGSSSTQPSPPETDFPGNIHWVEETVMAASYSIMGPVAVAVIRRGRWISSVVANFAAVSSDNASRRAWALVMIFGVLPVAPDDRPWASTSPVSASRNVTWAPPVSVPMNLASLATTRTTMSVGSALAPAAIRTSPAIRAYANFMRYLPGGVSPLLAQLILLHANMPWRPSIAMQTLKGRRCDRHEAWTASDSGPSPVVLGRCGAERRAISTLAAARPVQARRRPLEGCGALRPQADRGDARHRGTGSAQQGHALCRQQSDVPELPPAGWNAAIRPAADRRFRCLSGLYGPRGPGANPGGPHQWLLRAQHERARLAGGQQ